jgi:hypothetical protein
MNPLLIRFFFFLIGDKNLFILVFHILSFGVRSNVS